VNWAASGSRWSRGGREESVRHAYVAGWSAAEHWNLTEQVFKTLLVCTSDRLKQTRYTLGGTDLRARHVPDLWFFGTSIEWRDRTRVLVSDVHKTILDLCADPALGGGIQQVMHCLRAYLRRDDLKVDQLLTYATRMQVPTAFKRLGFLCEVVKGPTALIEGCRDRVTLGLAALDPVIPSPRVSKRWQLRLPAAWDRLLSDD
jgi:predicted transcriptional regulator of viral defense system